MKDINSAIEQLKSDNKSKRSCSLGENYVVISAEEMSVIYRAIEDIANLLSSQAAQDPEAYDDLIASLNIMSEFIITEKEFL
jgi:hypothetical protein